MCIRDRFRSASAFNQAVGGWSTGSVTDMSGMFESASDFNQDITGWSSASLTPDMSTGMFLDATAWLGNWARTDGEYTTHGPPSDWGEPCGNGWYDERVQGEQEDDFCEPEVNEIEVKGCQQRESDTPCKVKTNWKCNDPRSLRPGDDFDSAEFSYNCLLYTSPSPRDLSTSRMPSSA